MAKCVILINGKEIDITTLVEQLGGSLNSQSTPESITELFESNPELANEVYEALGLTGNIIQDNKSYYRGQLKPFKIDRNGNLILEPQYAGWQEEISYDKHKGMGISMSPDLSVANAQGNMFYEGSVNRPQDEGWMDERDAEDWITNAQNEGYYVLQVDKAYVTENFKDIFDNENYEQRIGTTEPIIIPKGKFKIENITPDVDTQITPQQKQQAQQLYSQYLDTIFPDSKVKDIVYRGSNDELLFLGKDFGGEIYFSPIAEAVKGYQEKHGKLYAAIINTLNPYLAKKQYETQERIPTGYDSVLNYVPERIDLKGFNYTDRVLEFMEKHEKEYTSFEELRNAAFKYGSNTVFEEEYGKGNEIGIHHNSIENVLPEIKVKTKEQIHILGSKQDIEGFKEFVNDVKLGDSLNDFNSIIGYAESVLNNSSTDELIQKRLEINKFEDISVDKLMPLDAVLVDGVVKNIDTVEDYYNLKHSANITKITRVNNVARNLKPLTISWKENGVSKNLFDLDSVLLKHYIIDRDIKDLGELVDLTDKRVVLLNAFIEKFNIKDVQTLSIYLSAWTERATQLLDTGLSLKSLLNTDLENVGEDLKTLFLDDSLVQDSLIDPEISKIYSIENGNVSKISDYSREPMEIILPNNFKQFQIDGHSLSEIKEKGSKFFEDIFKKAEKREDSLTISTRDSNSNIFVYSANERNFNKQPHNINLIEEYKEGEKILSYYEGTERVFYIKASEKSLYRIHKVGGVINVILLADNDISKIEVEIEAIIPGFFDDLDLLYEKLNSDTITDDDRNKVLSLLEQRNTLLEKKNQETENNSSYINFIKTFKNINYIIPPKKKDKLLSGIANRYYNLPGNGEFDINKIAKIQYNSWEKSLEYLAARIPAQSLQSVTSAKTVGFHSEGNIAYISTWMLYIQGADLDIDKAYLMGYSINNGATMSGDFKGIDLSEKKNFDIAISLPNIREKEIIFSNSPITTTEDKLFQDIWNNYDFINNANHDYSTFKRAVIKLTHLINASDSNKFKLNVGDIKLEGSFNKEYIDLINSINKNRLSKESTKTLDNLISIEDEIKFLKHIYP